MSKSSIPELATGPRRTTRVGGEPRSGVTPLAVTTGRHYVPGDIIDERYELICELGRGGMGVVWVAHSLVLKVDVALKLIRHAETGAEAATRMGREANAAARLTHPALVRVFDFGWSAHGDPFLVMELIRGESLSDTIIRKKFIEPRRAVQLILPIADGLRVAHANSVVHRDIKPGNIIVADEASNRVQPKLLDFGIAKVGHSSDGKLTQQGVVLGSPEYMSPEQALGLDQVDARSDVWSLGIALYEMVTGTVPFARPNYNALMQMIIHEAPPAITEPAEAAESGLWPIIAKALAKRPEERWANMDEFGFALAAWLYEQNVGEDVAGNSLHAVWLRESTGRRGLSSLPPRVSELPMEPITVRPAPANDVAQKGVRWPLIISGACLFGFVLWFVLSDFKLSGESESSAAELAAASASAAIAGSAQSRSAANPSGGVSPQDLPLIEEDARKRPAKSQRPTSAKKTKARRDFGF